MKKVLRIFALLGFIGECFKAVGACTTPVLDAWDKYQQRLLELRDVESESNVMQTEGTELIWDEVIKAWVPKPQEGEKAA